MAKIYMTKQGDTWDLISYEMYGSELFSREIMRANPNHLNTSIFDGNIKLTIPEVTPLAVDNTNLPPWRRNG